MKKLITALAVAFAISASAEQEVHPNVVDVQLGRSYTTSSGALTLAGAGNAKFSFNNPSGSGKVMYIYAYSVTSSAAALAYASLAYDATTSLPNTTTLTPRNQHTGSSNTSVAVVKTGVDLVTAISGGTVLLSLPVVPLARTTFKEETIILTANHTLTWNIAFLGAGDAVVQVFYYER